MAGRKPEVVARKRTFWGLGSGITRDAAEDRISLGNDRILCRMQGATEKWEKSCKKGRSKLKKGDFSIAKGPYKSGKNRGNNARSCLSQEGGSGVFYMGEALEGGESRFGRDFFGRKKDGVDLEKVIGKLRQDRKEP